ncbi:MAG: beta strand repeat-containing protein [Terriglobales bacterium]
MKTATLILAVCCLAVCMACGKGGTATFSSGGAGGGAGTGGGGSTPPPTTTPSLVSLVLSPGVASVAPGLSEQFTATGQYSDGSSQVVTNALTWSSSDTSVATIGNAGLANALVPGVVLVTAQSGTITGTATLDVTSAGTNLASISIAPAASSIPVNTTQQFSATGTYADGSSSDLTSLVTWTSITTAVVTVDANGLATGVAPGTSTISASIGGVTGSTTLTVNAPTISSISITPVDLTLAIGINQQFTATATYSDGSSQDLASGVTWTSSSPSVASINGAGLAATAGAGQTTLTATVGSQSDTTTLTVVAAHLISIDVEPQTASIALGTTQQFSAVGSFDDGSTQLLPSVTWTSSVPGTASINASGVATSVGSGSATISAISGSVTGTASLSVNSATLVSIAVAPANSSMAVGTLKQFTATGTFSDSSTQDLTLSVLWDSSNPATATVNNQGIAGSLATGTTTISAARGAISGSTGLTVSTSTLVSISIIPGNPRIEKGTSLRFTAVGTFSDGSTSSSLTGLSWKSSKPSIAQVRGSGLGHGKKSGSATVTASSGGIKGTTTLTVGTGTLTSVAITPANSSVTLGSTQQFTATGTFSDATTQDITLTTHWSSLPASVATIANAPSVAALATTHGVGTTAIGANSKGVTASTNMTVQ